MPYMTSYQSGEVVLVSFPFTDGGGSKGRPALVVLDTGDGDVLLARVTTKSYQTSYDAEIIDWQTAGLLAPSVVRVHKLATLAKSRLMRRLGQVQPADRKRVADALKQIFANW